MIAKHKICAVVAASDSKSALAQFRRALKLTSTIELRLDWLANDAEIRNLLSALGKNRISGATLIATCRRTVAGGKYRGSPAQQLVHLAEALRAGCAWYDLEIETASKCPPELIDVLLGEGCQLLSAHFFTPPRTSLQKVASRLAGLHPDGIKIAAEANTIAQSLEILDLASPKQNIVTVPMGESALPARVLALSRGSALAYAPVEHATAPGQVSLDSMLHLYRADKLTRKTRVYGVIGDPISHSLSPRLQNAGFQARKIDAVFLPFLVHDLKDFLGAIEPLGIRGFAITLPHKQTILRYLDECDPMAAAIGAVNTVEVAATGKLRGYNTDYVGVLRTLETRIPLRSSRVLIVGAGGAARAVAYALAQAGSSVCVTARRSQQAESLARSVGGEAVDRRRLPREFFDAIVNATPVGMHPLASESPLRANELNCRLVFDTIYRPRVTKLMQLAQRRGIETVSGLDMFIAQGTAQFEIWTGQRAPLDPMRRAVLKALANLNPKRTTRKS
jgi:3-dehydroquinate dehydratase/shikimate dehydrogenase